MILIDREKETGWLKEAYSRRNAELGVIYGRRRLGKTFLIKTFVADKPHFYFLAKQQDMGLELGRFKDKIGKKFNVFLEAKDLEGLFEEIKTKIAANHKKLIVVIDEFPYWVNKEQAIPSEFQSIWDEILKDSNVMLVLLGSYISVMEQKVIGYKSPLYGRRTFQILLQKLPIRCLKEFFPRYTEEELIKMYGCADTIPYYLALLEKNKSFKDNLMGFFNASSPPIQRCGNNPFFRAKGI